MSNSVFRVTEPDGSDSITVVVSEDGTITPNKELLKSFLSDKEKVDINLMTMKKIEAGNVNISLDSFTYVSTQDQEEEREEMDRIAKDLRNFRMDHDYTPLTSPTHRPAASDLVDDEIGQALSMLEEGIVVPPPLQQIRQPVETYTKITKIVKGKRQTILVNSKQKAKMISTGLLKERPRAPEEVFKKPKPVSPGKTIPKPKIDNEIESLPDPDSSTSSAPAAEEPAAPIVEETKEKEEETSLSEEKEDDDEEKSDDFEDFEDDLFDEDLEDEDDENDSDFEIEEELKPKPSRKTPSRKKPEPSRTRPERAKRRTSSSSSASGKQMVVEKVEAELVKPTETVKAVEAEAKPAEKKPVPKKEKKVPKAMPDDFALFSTPDIIRRVGKDKEPVSPVTPNKPAKIVPENRSKSDTKTKRLSTDSKPLGDKSPEKSRRLSLDVKKADRRPSVDSTSKPQEQPFPDNEPAISEDEQMDALPSAEDIRAIIQNESDNHLDLPDPTTDLHGDEQNNQMNLDAAGLDLDQSLLDNINTDLINEDILYQVAQSLVDNPDLQNVIDKSINEGNLVLDPGIQQALAVQPPLPQPPTTVVQHLVPHVEPVSTSINTQQPLPSSTTTRVDNVPKPGTQYVRPDGRVVVIPPIERPTTRSRNKRKESTPPPVRQPKPAHKPLDEEHVSGNELDSSEENEEEDESEDDPNKLWCICNQPHNNRFMICCDTCEEWYHGKCVNVTKAMGQMMEHEGKEWICVYCKDASLRRPKAALRRIRKASRTSTDSGSSSTKKVTSTTSSTSTSSTSLTPEEKHLNCVICGKPSRNSSIFCSDVCILKHSQHAQGVEKVVVYDRKSGKCLSGEDAPSAANLDKWLLQNPNYEVVRTTKKPVPSKPAPMTQSKLKLVKNSENEGVSLAIQKKGVNVGILQHAPKERSQSPHSKPLTKKITNIRMLSKQQNQPKIKVVPAAPLTPRPTLASTPAKPKLVQSKISLKPQPPPPEPKERKQHTTPHKTPKSREVDVSTPPKPENLRDTVKKTFFEQLSARLKKVDDLKLTEDELKGISNEIESQLYKCFGDTGQKYKNKYRSLIFNIKDIKNQTLWRRICEKAVNPYQLVRLSPDDLASQELALWREREAKHQLDMIKKTELELMKCNRQFVFKTHKGEQVFEDDRPKDQVAEVIAGLDADSSTPLEKEKDSVDGKGEKEKRGSKHKSDRSRDRNRDHRGHSTESSKSKRDKSESDRKRDKRSSSRDRKKRSRSKERSSRHNDRKRSRSRDRHKRSHKSSRYRKEEKSISTERLDKKSKEILEQLVDKHIVPPLEDRLWKHVPQEDLMPVPTVESDSDHEPSSTVTIPTPPRSSEPDDSVQSKTKSQKDSEDSADDKDSSIKSPEPKPLAEVIWKGSINMIDVAQISITAHEVSGDCNGLGEELPPTLDIVGRISPDTVWDYITKMKSSNSKTISVIRMTATNMEERMPYLALYSYLSSRNRLGVVKSVTKAVKDFYILPLASHTPIPEPLLPITGPGFEDSRPALLLGILVRDKKKRVVEPLPPVHVHKKVRVDIVTPPAAPSTPPPRSYTPPPNRDPRINKIAPASLPVPPSEPEEEPEPEPADDMDEPYSPEDSDPETMPETPTNSRLNADDLSSLLSANVKTSSFLDSGINTQTFEPFNNKFYNIPGLEEASTLPSNSLELQREMAELDQRIAAQKAEIHKVSQDLVSSATSDIGTSNLANIALPSNLQQILESIKTIGSKTDSIDSQGENSSSSIRSATSDLTIPLMLPKLSSRPLIGTAASQKSSDHPPTIPLNLPKSLKAKSTGEPDKAGSVLSSLSEEDLIKKAEEMLAECEPAKRTRDDSPPAKRARIPGLNDD